MIKEGHFGYSEAFSLVTITIITKVFFISPQVVVNALGTAAWQGTLISCFTALAFFYLLYRLMNRFPELDLYQIFEAVAGKVVGKGLTLVFAAYLLYYTSVTAKEFVVVLNVYSLPLTPTNILILMLLLLMLAMAYVGLEGIARIAHLFYRLIIGGFLLLILLAIPNYDLAYLYPFWGNGIRETTLVGLSRAAAYNEIVFLAIIIRAIHGVEVFKKVGILSLFISGMIFATALASVVMTFQYTVGGEHLSSLFHLARIITFSRFFERVEVIFLFIWMLSSFITISFAFYLTISAYCRVFQIQDHKPLLISFAALVYIISTKITYIGELIEVHVKILRVYSSAILYGIPILILMVAILTGKKGRRKRKHEAQQGEAQQG